MIMTTTIMLQLRYMYTECAACMNDLTKPDEVAVTMKDFTA